jgi:tetratricopeptide (TPR) repeat protein
MRFTLPTQLVRYLLLVLTLGGCRAAFADAPPKKTQPAKKAEPHFEGMGKHTRHISTKSTEAQRFFDQGLIFLYGFNHDEAIRSFEAAAANDPKCAMAYWGIAMANGPHINSPSVDKPHAKAAWEALKQARDHQDRATPVEKALIEALAARYADPQPEDRHPLDKAFADAMRKVWAAYPDDADVGALTAEAIMDLRPWDQWTPKGKPQPGTEEVLGILDAVIAKSPAHPLALHLYIHANEASLHPERADAAAARLRDLDPAIGHLVHMPSHIDVRRGRWQEAVVTNELAIAADKKYRTMVPQQGSYRIYMAHNYHMLGYAALMQGQSQKSGQAFHELLAAIPDDYVKENAATVDGFFAMPYELHMRFGRWDEMLAEPKPSDILPITGALWHYGRGIAFAAKGQLDKAKAEQKDFLTAKKSLPRSARFRKNSGSELLGIAQKMLEGEILYRDGKTEEGIAALKEAVGREDRQHYSEPPNWIQPVRHALGATLLDAKRYAEAEAVYREDLAHYPENGWSLYGLARSLKTQGKTEEAHSVGMHFEKAWQHADVKLKSSCFCLEAKD